MENSNTNAQCNYNADLRRFSLEERASGMKSTSLFMFDCKDSTDSADHDAGHFLSSPKAEIPWSGGLFKHESKGNELRSTAFDQGTNVDEAVTAPIAVSCHNDKEEKGRSYVNEQLAIAPGSSSDATIIGLELRKRSSFEVNGKCTSAAPRTTTAKKVRCSGHIPRCQVEGCKADLTSAKDYHRRHKVCASHSKSSKVIVAGQEQRFCQQCSRFHGLGEFDEGKRSCRRRLAGHNERRRKPQPDPLALSAGFLSAFQDRRMGHFFTDRSCFLPPRIPGVSALWDERDDIYSSQQKGAWPRIFKYESHSSFESPLPGTGVERQLFFPGLSQHSNDRSSLLLPQSPKGMIPNSNDVSGSVRTHQYLQGSAAPLGQSLTLTPSSSGAGVLAGLEATPIGQGFTRVSDSGRALSLQSTMQLWSSPAPVAVSLDTMTLHSANMLPDQYAHDENIPMAHPILEGQQQLDWVNEKLLSSASNLISISSAGAFASNEFEKNQLEVPFTHGVNGAVGSHDTHPLYCMLQADVSAADIRGRQDVDTACLSLAEHSASSFLRAIPCGKQSPRRYAGSEVI